MRLCTTIIPALAVILAGIFIYIGKAADYDAGDVVMDDAAEGVPQIQEEEAQEKEETNQA